jgi:hypothetical protein
MQHHENKNAIMPPRIEPYRHPPYQRVVQVKAEAVHGQAAAQEQLEDAQDLNQHQLNFEAS